MAIFIVENSGKVSYGIKRYICKTMEDIPVEVNGEEIAPGSKIYVTDEKKTYMLNTAGQWVEITESSGGGASALSDLTDVNLSELADGQVLKYDGTSEKWVNADSNYRTIHSTLKVYRTMDSYETTISIYDDSNTLLYEKVINAGNFYGHFDPITEHFEVSGVTNTITMYGDGTDADTAQNWLHITINELSYDLGNTVRNPSYPLDLSIDSAVKTGAPAQSDWNESDTTSDAYILNKPTIPSAITELNDVPDVDITEPTDGQVIKYDAAQDKWINAAGGGGSSITVIPGTLSAGETSITFTDERILDDSIVSCATPAGINPTAMTSTTGSVTFYFQSQAADMVVKVVIF